MKPQDKVLVLLDDISRYLREIPGGLVLTDEALARLGLTIQHDPQRMVTTLSNPTAHLVIRGELVPEDDDPTAPEPHRLGGEPPEYSGIWTTPDPIEPRIT